MVAVQKELIQDIPGPAKSTNQLSRHPFRKLLLCHVMLLTVTVCVCFVCSM